MGSYDFFILPEVMKMISYLHHLYTMYKDEHAND